MFQHNSNGSFLVPSVTGNSNTPSKTEPRTFEVSYRVVALREWDQVAVRFEVMGHDGKIILPIPRWFRDHTYKVQIKAPDGKKVLRTETRGLWDYVDFVVLDKVVQYLDRLGYRDYAVKICEQK
jgi:hypothetical protein